jgi:hypothetical protein
MAAKLAKLRLGKVWLETKQAQSVAKVGKKSTL